MYLNYLNDVKLAVVELYTLNCDSSSGIKLTPDTIMLSGDGAESAPTTMFVGDIIIIIIMTIAIEYRRSTFCSNLFNLKIIHIYPRIFIDYIGL